MTKKTVKTKPTHLKKATKKGFANTQQPKLPYFSMHALHPCELLTIISLGKRGKYVAIHNLKEEEENELALGTGGFVSFECRKPNNRVELLFESVKIDLNEDTLVYTARDTQRLKQGLEEYLNVYQKEGLVDWKEQKLWDFKTSMKKTLKMLELEQLTNSGSSTRINLDKLECNFLEDVCILEQVGYVILSVPATIDADKPTITVTLNKPLQAIQVKYCPRDINNTKRIPIASHQGIEIYNSYPFVVCNGSPMYGYRNNNVKAIKILTYMCDKPNTTVGYDTILSKAGYKITQNLSLIGAQEQAIKRCIKQDINKPLKDLGCIYYLATANKGIYWSCRM